MGQLSGSHTVRGMMLVTALLTSGAVFGFGFSIQPITREFRPSGAESSQVFQLYNPEDRAVAIELSVLTREQQSDGSETREPADDLFTIFPARVVLEPEERRSVRVRWQGSEELEQEQAYRLLAEQLPVDFDQNGAESETEGGVINIMFRYLAAIYITPPGVEPDIRAEVDRQENGRVWVAVRNRGDAHRILEDLSLTLELSDGSTEEYPPEALEDLAGHNLLAGSSRIYPLQLPDGTAAEVQDVSIQLAE